MRLDHRVLIQQGQKPGHGGAERLFIFKPVPVDRDPFEIFHHQPAHNGVTEVARYTGSRNPGNFRIVKQRIVRACVTQSGNLFLERFENRFNLFQYGDTRWISTKKKQLFMNPREQLRVIDALPRKGF